MPDSPPPLRSRGAGSHYSSHRHSKGLSWSQIATLTLVGFIIFSLITVVKFRASLLEHENSLRRGRHAWRRALAVDPAKEAALATSSHRPADRHANRSHLSRFPAARLTHLVLVACHSVFTGLDYHSEGDSSWFLLEYQKSIVGQTRSFVSHIEMGVGEAAADPQALLLFSGGKTRQGSGPRSEGEGYWLVAEAHDWWDKPQVRERAFSEDHARDSFENVIFGLCRFYELTGHYPERLTVVGYEFKEARFRDQHRAAIKFPSDRFAYVGTPALSPNALEGEAAAARAFETDPYGCSGELLAKRESRDPYATGGYSAERCPAMADLLEWCGPAIFDAYKLPWEQGGR